MIEDDRRWGYRPCVGIMLVHEGKVLLVRDPLRRPKWDVPQGGIEPGEHEEHALIRELIEELGPEWIPCLDRTVPVGCGLSEFPVYKDGRWHRGKTYYYHAPILTHLPSAFSEWEKARARNCDWPAPAREYRDLFFATNAEARSLLQPWGDNKAAMLSRMLDALSSSNLIR